MGTKKTEVMTNIRHGLGFSEEAKKQLGEAKSESAVVKLNVLLEICFKCRLCGVQASGGELETTTWQRFSDIRHHLATRHGICKETTTEFKKPLGVVTRSRCRKRNDVTVHSSTANDDIKDGELARREEAVKLCDDEISRGKNQLQKSDDVSALFSDELCVGSSSGSSQLVEEIGGHEAEPQPASPMSSDCSDTAEYELEERGGKLATVNYDKRDNASVFLSDNEATDQVISPITENLKSVPVKVRRMSYLKRARTCPECEQVLDNIEHCWEHYAENHNITVKLRAVLSLVKNRDQSGTKSFFACPVCSKQLRGACLLKHIILVHLWRPKLKSIRRKREMLCPMCGKAFNYEQNYYLHLRSVHGGMKPKSRAKYVAKEYKCSQCEYRTCETRRLNSHTKYAHSGIKAYSCKYCSYATWERTSLRDHLYRHKESKPYHCDLCSYQCIQKKQLRAHLMHVHSVSLPKTGHTRMPPRTGMRHVPSNIVQMADRETSTDPPPKRAKSKASKGQVKSPGRIMAPKVSSSNCTSGQVTSIAVSQSTPACSSVNTPLKKQILHYSVQGPVISQLSSPNCTSSPQFSSDVQSVICAFTVPSQGVEQVQNLILPPIGQPVTPQKDLVLAPGIEQSGSRHCQCSSGGVCNAEST
ncbi:hypothetical protein LSH36_381g02094 [Paralvinella palmiformis]|uniref:C2H2-type domain-containing protein n=1 Tax=Paralvinella palmiformis TaxID=53620 RepID=A0AAD9JD42_9ANNE|nr:hypothetical protein LSH36_381g02094 [Paralvinella palmiformis]